MIEVAELPDCVDATRPQIVHLAAHSRDGAVFLTLVIEPVSVQHGHLAQALLSAQHRPQILLLNFCRSIAVSVNIPQVAPAVICWPDRVDDGHCRELANVLCRGLAGGDSLGASMDRVKITLSRYDALARPQLVGDATARLR